MEVLGVRRLWILHVNVDVSAVCQLGLGWWMVIATRRQLRPGPWTRRLCGLIGGSHGRRHGGAGWRDSAWAADRQVHQRRQTGSHPRPSYPDGDCRDVDPGIWLVRV